MVYPAWLCQYIAIFQMAQSKSLIYRNEKLGFDQRFSFSGIDISYYLPGGTARYRTAQIRLFSRPKNGPKNWFRKWTTLA